MEHRLLPVIRWALAFLLAAACYRWWPDLSLAVFAAAGFGNFPGCEPCCEAGVTCLCDPDYDRARQFQVDLGSIGNATHCTNCTCFNGTFFTDFNSEGLVGSVYTCNWTASVTCDSNCSGDCASGDSDAHTLNVQLSGDSTWRLRVTMAFTGGGSQGAWQKSYGAATDCDAWALESVSADGTGANLCLGFSGHRSCTYTTATCEVSSAP